MDIENVVKIQNEFFQTNATRDSSFRINALKKLRETILKNEQKAQARRLVHDSNRRIYFLFLLIHF